MNTLNESIKVGAWELPNRIIMAVPSIYSIRLTTLALTQIQIVYRSHVISNTTRINFSAEVAPCVGPGKPRATSST